jgi:hypothetical protein
MRLTVCDRRQATLLNSLIEPLDRLTNEGLAARNIIRAGSHSACHQAVYGVAVHPAYRIAEHSKTACRTKA